MTTGNLTVLFGCMYAQKTTEILRSIRRFKAIGYNALVVNYIDDIRYGENIISSHDFDSYNAVCVRTMEEINNQVLSGEYRVVVIDEGQFFKDIYKYVQQWVDTLPIHIIVAGLSGDSNRKPFGDMLQLIPIADEIIHLTALCSVCNDGTLAPFTKCIANKENQIAIGGQTMYIAVCRRHFLE